MVELSFTIEKCPYKSLGLRIGGGKDDIAGPAPVYVANAEDCSPVHKGDIVLAVNNRNVFGLDHDKAVEIIQNTLENTQVHLKLLRIRNLSEKIDKKQDFVPSWHFWQQLPMQLSLSKDCKLRRRSSCHSWGFSIVGGNLINDAGNIYEPIQVLFVVPGSQADMEAGIRCGDRVVAVEGQSVADASHDEVVSLLKYTDALSIGISIVSWLGTEL